jgi:hypothetical protein
MKISPRIIIVNDGVFQQSRNTIRLGEPPPEMTSYVVRLLSEIDGTSFLTVHVGKIDDSIGDPGFLAAFRLCFTSFFRLIFGDFFCSSFTANSSSTGWFGLPPKL